MAKILISAGEASGDVHAAAVTKALKKIDPSCEVFGISAWAATACVKPAARFCLI